MQPGREADRLGRGARAPWENKLIKVDRVRSVDEAIALEKLGTDLIGVDLAPDPRFDDGREITVEQAVEIDTALSRASLVPVMNLDDDPGRIVQTAQAVHARMVQPVRRAVLSADVRAGLSEAGIGIVCAGIEIAHDDDPGWVISDYTAQPDLEVSFFQADVLPEYHDSWAFLRDRAPEYEQEFQVTDLNDLAIAHPLLVGLDFTADNVREIADTLSPVRGWVFTLGERARRGGVRFHSYADALTTLEALRG
ncbi:hypothetical protein KOI35_28350 [Actinoplanes bogorensis]|uniref:Phosphoribosylanthranilate isomerase n=1 Tax=Paractinoplanes bogorensis TaxID=1610840 RepID=A0ABS5YXJ2_9ACTN|nr:hypothetical protein [Actinoplanes bogorensis]MBU2667429.1 hypothetical protein [Actinoplanes bogorensis]